MDTTAITCQVGQASTGIGLDGYGQKRSRKGFRVPTVMVLSTLPSPATKSQDQDEMVSYVPYCPEARLQGMLDDNN